MEDVVNDPKGLIIACKVLKDQLESVGPLPYDVNYLEQGLHRTPSILKEEIQAMINANPQYDTIILGYGLCSRAVIGLKALAYQTIIIPKIDDCIGLSLGERSKYYEQFTQYPGSYYFTKGWTEAAEDPLKEYHRTVEKFGIEVAEWTIRATLVNYERTVLIKTSEVIEESVIQYVKTFADFFNLQYVEMMGSLNYIRKLVLGPWDSDFVVVEGGMELEDEMFS